MDCLGRGPCPDQPGWSTEPIDGQPTDVYCMEATTPKSKSNAKIWISATSGLPLHQHTILIEGATVKGELDVRYTNVTPAGGSEYATGRRFRNVDPGLARAT